jgi:hypothetical protein
MNPEHAWLGKRLDCIEEKLDKVRLEVAALKVKAAVSGAVSGLLMAAAISRILGG